MNVQELIDKLQNIEDKTLEVGHRVDYGDNVKEYFESIDEVSIQKGSLFLMRVKSFVNLK